MHPRTTARRSGTARAAAAAALIGLLVTGCGGAGPAGSPTAPAPGSAPATPAPEPAPSSSATTVPPAEGRWGAYPQREEACAAVAEDLLALALLPASLSGNPTVEQVQDVEDQVAAVLAAAPPELAADFARVRLLVDTHGEEIAQDPDAVFDGQALDASLAPVRDWLDETCRDPD